MERIGGVMTFHTMSDLCRFMNHFEGELIIRKNGIYNNGVLIGKYVKLPKK